MKRIFAILFAAMLLTACSEKGETVVEDISATESVAVEATTVTTEEVTTSEAEETTTAEPVKEYPLNSSADICLSALSFGMGKQEAEAAVNAPLDEELLNPFYSNYNDVSVDLDERLSSAMFSYGESGLDEIALYSGARPENESFELRDKLIEQLSGIYGFAAEDWEIENGGITNYCENDNVSAYIRLYTADGLTSVTLMITSSEHRNFKDVAPKPVLQ